VTVAPKMTLSDEAYQELRDAAIAVVRAVGVDTGGSNIQFARSRATGVEAYVVPGEWGADAILEAEPRAVLIGNGPGDPAQFNDQIEAIKQLLGRIPLFGVCLGHQLLGLALGHTTFKLPFGHRGANHPVLERATNGVLVTSQNHGFAVSPTQSREETHISLYDGTVEGLELRSERARSVQFHPEAGPGPHDAWGILESWVEEVSGLAKAA